MHWGFHGGLVFFLVGNIIIQDIKCKKKHFSEHSLTLVLDPSLAHVCVSSYLTKWWNGCFVPPDSWCWYSFSSLFSFVFLQLRVCSVELTRWSVNVKQIKVLLPAELLKCLLLNVTVFNWFLRGQNRKCQCKSIRDSWKQAPAVLLCSPCPYPCLLTLSRCEHLLVLKCITTLRSG